MPPIVYFPIGIIETKHNANYKKEFVFDNNTKEPFIIDFNNIKEPLVDAIKITVNQDISAKVVIKYFSNEAIYQSSCINIVLENNAKLDLIVCSNVSSSVAEALAIDAEQKDNSIFNLQIFDFSSQNLVQNIHSKLIGDNTKIDLKSVYFGQNQDRQSINYLFDVLGKRCDAKMNVVGILTGDAQKNFVGTIDFKRGSKGSVGEESEFCLLLSNNVKAKSTPILLSAEEQVDGKHSSSVAKLDDDKLFYVMSRGLSKTDAVKMYVKSKLNQNINLVFDENLKNEILYQIERRLNIENKWRDKERFSYFW